MRYMQALGKEKVLCRVFSCHFGEILLYIGVSTTIGYVYNMVHEGIRPCTLPFATEVPVTIAASSSMLLLWTSGGGVDL